MGAELKVERKRYFWTTREISLLRELCASEVDAEKLESSLAGRSSVAIYQKAKELGIDGPWVKASNGSPWSKRNHSANDDIDTVLKVQLSENREKGALKALSERLNIPAWELSRRAGVLGLNKPRLKEERWSGAEIDIVDFYGEEGVPEVARQLKYAGFTRTSGSIGTMIKRRQIEKLANSAMSARAVAEMMGVDGKTVVRWIETMNLKGKNMEGTWRIGKKDLKKWLLDHPTAFSLKAVNQGWFMGIIGGNDDLYDF